MSTVAYIKFSQNQLEKIGNIYDVNFVPLDNEGYVQSFTLNEKEDYLKFFTKYPTTSLCVSSVFISVF
jgi:hypothetical protein